MFLFIVASELRRGVSMPDAPAYLLRRNDSPPTVTANTHPDRPLTLHVGQPPVVADTVAGFPFVLGKRNARRTDIAAVAGHDDWRDTACTVATAGDPRLLVAPFGRRDTGPNGASWGRREKAAKSSRNAAFPGLRSCEIHGSCVTREANDTTNQTKQRTPR